MVCRQMHGSSSVAAQTCVSRARLKKSKCFDSGTRASGSFSLNWLFSFRGVRTKKTPNDGCWVMVMAVFACLFVFFRFSNILDASLISFFLKWFSLFFLPLKLWSLPVFWLFKKIFIFFLVTRTAFLQCLSCLMLKTNCVPSSIWCCSDFLAWNCNSMFTPLSHFCFLLTMTVFFAV